MNEIQARAAIIASARSWIGTPYMHQAKVKGVGVDCGQILIDVFCGLGLVPPFDPGDYTRDWFNHRDEEKYLGFVFDNSVEVAAPEPGDIMLFKFGRTYSHAGIVSHAAPLTIIHASAPMGCVLEEVAGNNPDILGRVENAKYASVVRKVLG